MDTRTSRCRQSPLPVSASCPSNVDRRHREGSLARNHRNRLPSPLKVEIASANPRDVSGTSHREGQLIRCLVVSRNRAGEFPAETIELRRTLAIDGASRA